MLIDHMIRSKQHPYPSKLDLLEACQDKFGVRSESTIEKDLNAMRMEFEAPIAYSKREKGYYYADSKFKLMGMNLSADNVEALQFVGVMLEGFRDLPVFTEFSDAVDKVLDGVEMTAMGNDEGLPFNKVIQIQKSDYTKGSEMLGKMIRYVKEQKVVEITYRKFGAEEPQKYTVHAYLLKEYNDLWYLTGYVEERDRVQTFGVDRIEEVADIHKELVPADAVNFEPDNFFRYCLGVTALAEEPQEILLAFDQQTANYIKTSPVHPTQEILKEEGGACIVRLKLVNNFELRSWLMSFGPNVRILEPAFLRDEIKNAFQQALNAYDKLENKA
ncbi:WYL domain-containing transcriptional regulator [Algivirga pacifica]|uniref:WYL domain-containing transcriptional regulator n=2 Tax=Algivirga pacifica TaxID=1162670 RepID=A0ABP9D4P1_9BACT